MDIDEKIINQQKYVFEYFKAHAAQRLMTFNFYIIIFTFFSTGYALTFRHDILYPFLIRSFISLLLIMFSYIFFMLDKRNKLLIKNAEKALRYLESCILKSNREIPEIVHVFRYEEFFTDNLKSMEEKNNRICDFLKYNWSYSKCFNSIFIIGTIMGIIGIILSLILMLRC